MAADQKRTGKKVQKTKRAEEGQLESTTSLFRWGRLSLVLSVTQTLFILALVGLAVITFGARIPWLASAGLQFFAVTSGSMEPAIPAGSIISVGKYKLDDLSAGDVVTYTISPDGGQPAVVTHRIIDVDKQESVQAREVDGEMIERTTISYELTTQGDANSEPDPYTIGPNNIIGLYQWHLPYLGYVSSYAQTSRGFLTLVILPAAALIAWEIVTLVWYFRNKYKASAEAEIAQLKKKLGDKDVE